MENSSNTNNGKIFVGGLIEGVHYPSGKKNPIIDVDGCTDIIIVSSDYFLKNKDLIEMWASKKLF